MVSVGRGVGVGNLSWKHEESYEESKYSSNVILAGLGLKVELILERRGFHRELI